MKRLLLIVPLLLVACEEELPANGKVYERIYREAHTTSELDYQYDYINDTSRLVFVDKHHPEKFLLDIVDEAGKEHRVTVPESVWVDCQVDEWYNPSQGGSCS